MSVLLLSLGLLVLALLWVRVLALVVGAHALRGAAAVRDRSLPASAPPAVDPPRPVARAGTGGSSPGRRGLALLGTDERDLAVARAVAQRHLPRLAREGITVPAADPGAGSGGSTGDLGAARVAVASSSRAGDTRTALRECAAVGLPLLLTARR